MTNTPLDHDAILKARATLSGHSEGPCDTCASPLVFALQAGEHQISLDLITLLRCLKLAEREQAVPAIDSEWWNIISCDYKVF